MINPADLNRFAYQHGLMFFYVTRVHHSLPAVRGYRGAGWPLFAGIIMGNGNCNENIYTIEPSYE